MTNVQKKSFFPSSFDYSKNRICLSWNKDIIISFLRSIPVPKNGLCLDLGAGDARYRNLIKENGYKWIGMDNAFSKELIVIGDAHYLPFLEEKFDLVFLNHVLRYLPDPWRALRDVNRVLKKGSFLLGTATFLEPFDSSYFQFSHWAVEKILIDTGFTLIKMQPGTNTFRALAGVLVKPGPSWLDAFLVKVTIPPIMFLRKVLGYTYIFLRYGKDSNEYSKLIASFDKLPLKYAAHIIFLARKSG